MDYARIHPELAQRLLNGEKEPELYKLVFLAKVPPDDGDITRFALAQFTTHLFAKDADEARAALADGWERNMPTGATLLFVLANAPAPGGIQESSMWERVAAGPRRLEH